MTSLAALTTTGIGSLPHHAVEAALEQAFRVDVPYLPQLPQRDPREFMLAQATEGVPGIVHDEQGMIAIDLDAWKRGASAYDQRLQAAFEQDQLKGFLPSSSYMAAWEPFVARVRDEKRPLVKIQIAGPMTVQWSLRTTDGRFPPPAALTHVSRTILARTMAMVDALKAAGVEPICFVDEPGLYAFSRTQPGHIVMLQDLRINLLALKRRGARVGLHCCSDADWGAIMGLGLDVLAIDARLSLQSLLKAGEALVTFVSMGGRLALGVIPTDRREEPVPASQLFHELTGHLFGLEQYFPTRASIFENILSRSLLTPACGLAFLSEARASQVVDELEAFRARYRTKR